MVWTDVATSTSIGTSTTKTQLNGGASLTTPSQATVLVEYTPYQAPTAALTAAETMATKIFVESVSIGSIQPKIVALPGISGGLSTFPFGMIPALKSFRADTVLPASNTPIDYYAQAYIANTAAPRAGVNVTYSDERVSPVPGLNGKVAPNGSPMRIEQFWDCNSATTAAGTTAASVTLNSITINQGRAINNAYGQLYPATITASESYIGYWTVSSADMLGIQKIRFSNQPIASGLGTTTAVGAPVGIDWTQGIGLQSTATIGATFTVEEALTGNGNVTFGLGFIR